MINQETSQKVFSAIGMVASFVAAITGVMLLVAHFAINKKPVPHALAGRFVGHAIEYWDSESDSFDKRQVKDQNGTILPLVLAKIEGDNMDRLWWGTESYPAPWDIVNVYLAYPKDVTYAYVGMGVPRRPVYMMSGEKAMWVQIGHEAGPKFRTISELVFAQTYGYPSGSCSGYCQAIGALGDPLYLGYSEQRNESGEVVALPVSVVWGTKILGTYKQTRIKPENLHFVVDHNRKMYVPIYNYYDKRDGKDGVVTVLDGKEWFVPTNEGVKAETGISL